MFRLPLLFAALLVLIQVQTHPTLAFWTEEKAPEKERAESARTTEERLASLEDRFAVLEDRLGTLLEKLSSSSETIPPEVQAEVALIVEEVEDLGTESDSIPTAGAEPQGGQDPISVATDQTSNNRVPYGGYMEFHLNHDNINPTTLDFHRFVLLYGHQFNDRIRFVGELELEHALVEGGEASGELELEQAYLDFLLTPALSFRAGMMLTPIGIVNERHEPASFNGVERNFVDTFIIPSTWFSNGAGLVGDLGRGFSFKAFAMSSLNGAFFSAEEGFRDGRQKGFFDNASNVAAVGRLQWAGLPDLDLGTTFWIGNTGLDFERISARTNIFEFDGQYSFKRFDFRGQFAITNMDEADLVNLTVQRQIGVNPNLAQKMRGYYLEGAAHLLPEGSAHDVVAFYRYDNFDTQFRMPDGFLPTPRFDRSAHILGVTYLPFPDIAFKFDYNFMRNASSVIKAPNRWNFGIGWWF